MISEATTLAVAEPEVTKVPDELYAKVNGDPAADVYDPWVSKGE